LATAPTYGNPRVGAGLSASQVGTTGVRVQGLAATSKADRFFSIADASLTVMLVHTKVTVTRFATHPSSFDT
jgi:hypothetical protein